MARTMGTCPSSFPALSLSFPVPSCVCGGLHVVADLLYIDLVCENENGSGRLLPAVAA